MISKPSDYWKFMPYEKWARALWIIRVFRTSLFTLTWAPPPRGSLWSSSCCFVTLNWHLLICCQCSSFAKCGGSSISNRYLYLSPFGVTELARKFPMEKCFPVAPTPPKQAGFLGLVFPKTCCRLFWLRWWGWLVKQPCYIRGHEVDLDNVYRRQWGSERNF